MTLYEIVATSEDTNYRGRNIKDKNSGVIDVKRKDSHGEMPELGRRESIEIVLSFWTSFRGILAAGLAGVLYTANAAIVKHLSDINPSMLMLISFSLQTILSLIMIESSSRRDRQFFGPPDCRGWVIAQALATTSAIYLRYVASQMLALANAIIITLCSPIFAFILAKMFLNEPCGLVHGLSAFGTMAGILLTAKPQILFGLNEVESGINIQKYNNDRYYLLIGLASGLGSAFSDAISMICLRKMQNVHHSVILFVDSIISAVVMLLITAYFTGFHIPSCGNAPWLMISIGFISFCAELLSIKALQFEQATIVSIVDAALDIVPAFLFQIIVFGETPDFLTFIGALMITFSLSLIIFPKYLLTRSSDHFLRRWFKFILN